MPVKKGARSSEPKGKKKVTKKRKSLPAELDEEISSDSDVFDELDDFPNSNKRKADLESSDEDVETAQEKRVRLAQEYVAKIRENENDQEYDDELKKEAIIHRLRDEQLDLAGKLKKYLADKVDTTASFEEVVLKCREQRSPITCVVLSTDNKFVFCGAKDGSIVKYDIQEKKRVGVIKRSSTQDAEAPKGHKSSILALTISDDFKYLASSCQSGMILVWNPNDLSFLGNLKGHRGPVTALAIQKGGNYQLYSASGDKTVKVWSLLEMAYIETLFGHQDSITGIDCLRRERAITSGGRDSSLRIWKIPEESQLVFNGPDGNSIDCVKLIDEQTFVSGDDNGTVSYWSALKKKPLHSEKNAHDMASGVPFWITALGAVHNADIFASGSSNGQLRLWKIQEEKRTFEPLVTIPLTGFVNGLQFSTDGKFLVAAVGKEHRLGRWSIIKGAVNSVRVFRLPLKT